MLKFINYSDGNIYGVKNSTTDKNELLINLKDCIGVNFELKDLDHGIMTIVQKTSQNLSRYFAMILHLFLGYILWHVVGPLSSLLITSIFAIACVQKQMISSLFFSCLGSTMYYLLVKMMAPIYFYPSFLFIVLLILSNNLAVKVSIRMSTPHVFYFSSDELQVMFQLKHQIEQLDITKYWTSNYYIESILAFLTPHWIYNNWHFREAIKMLIEFLIPLFAILQTFSILGPLVFKSIISIGFLVTNDFIVQFIVNLFSLIKIILPLKLLRVIVEWIGSVVKFFQRFSELMFNVFDFCERWAVRIHYIFIRPFEPLVRLIQRIPVLKMINFCRLLIQKPLSILMKISKMVSPFKMIIKFTNKSIKWIKKRISNKRKHK